MLHFGSNVRRRHDPVSSRPDELNISFSCLSARWRAFTWLRVQCQGTPQQAYQSFLVCTTTYCSHCGTPVFGAVFPVGPAGERTGVCSQFTVRQPKCLLRTSSDVTWVIYNLLKFKPQAVYKDLTLYIKTWLFICTLWFKPDVYAFILVLLSSLEERYLIFLY